MKANVPSLQYMTVLKIATSLWNESNILRCVFDDYPWHYVEERVETNVQRLELPSSFRKRVADVIRPVGYQIASWIENHCANKSLKALHVFFWNPRGTIDKQRTAMELIQNGKNDLIDRYMLACFYCLETEIRSLWKRIDKDDFNRVRKLLSNHIASFWTMQMNPKMTGCPRVNLKWMGIEFPQCSHSLLALKVALESGNLVAVEYFLPKLTTEEKNGIFENLPSLISLCLERYPYHHRPDIFYYLFLSMNQRCQSEVLRLFSYDILHMFLHWPWQDLFVQFARICIDFLSQEQFVQLLKHVLFCQHVFYKDCNDLFEQLWMESPVSFRRFMVDEDFTGVFMCLEPDDAAKITLFLEDATQEEKNGIIFSKRGMYICKNLAFSELWTLFECFVNECLDTTYSVSNFKQKFTAYFTPSDVSEYGKLALRDEISPAEKSELLKEAHLILDSLFMKRTNKDGCDV